MTRSIFIAAALSVAALAAGAANAQDRQAAQISVFAKHVDFNSARETRGFYAKLNAAAHQVCTREVSDPMTSMADATCEHEAVTDAVRQIDAPQLSALDSRPDRAPAYAEHSQNSRHN